MVYFNKETNVDVAMIEQSATCIVAADRTKFGQIAFAKISDITVADYIVTNSGVNKESLYALQGMGVEIITADPQ